MPRLRATVALRLTLWYAAAFALSTLLAMALAYSFVAGVLHAETDGELRQDLQEAAGVVREGGAASFREELSRELAGPDSAEVYLRLWSADAEPVAAAGFPAPDEAARAAVRERLAGASPLLRTIQPPDSDDRVRVGYASAAPGYVVEFGQPLGRVDELLATLRAGMFLALAAALLMGGPVGWFMARRALRPVETVTRAALEIGEGALDRRVPVGPRGDELDRLARAFNMMLDRIGSLLVGMREVTDNLAHDLRTPLARIRASAERAAARGAHPDEWAAFAGTTTEECDRVLQILNGTLEIAEAQAGATRLRLEDVDMAALVREARDLFLTLAEDAGVSLDVAAPQRCIVRVDRSRVQRIVANLVDNALKYTPEGGTVVITLVDEAGDVRVEVRDSGPGVSAEELPRIFERFYRGDGSRTGSGSGLGLSLARAFARAHGGDLTAVSAPGRGSTFTLRLRRGAS